MEDIMKAISRMKEITAKSGENPFSKICQIGIVVKDLENTISFLENTFGLGPFTRIPQEEGGIGVCEIGGLQIELIQNSVMGWKEGSIHLAFFVEDMDKQLNELQEKGIGILKRDSVGGLVDFAYLDTEKKSNIIFELIQVTA